MLYLVSYDLLKPGKDYDSLWQALGQLYATRILESEWLLVSQSDATSIWRALERYVDTNDRLWVAEVTKNMQWGAGKLIITDAQMQALMARARA